MSRCRGFTLLEICIAFTVLAALSIAAVPPFLRAQESYRLTAAAHEIRSELHRARILAITRNQDCRLSVVSSVRYRIECETPAWTEIQSREMPPGFEVSANNEPEFHPLGNVGPMATVRVWNRYGAERRIIVSRSGRVRIE